MENIKVRVLRLNGCGWCEEVIRQLTDLNIPFQTLDANKEGELADRLESLLNTLLYPIIIVDRELDTWYIYRPSDEVEINKVKAIGYNNFKLGCITIADLVKSTIKLLK